MGGRGATASFNGIKASSYTKTFSKQLELSDADRRFLNNPTVSGASQSITHFRSSEGTVKTNVTIKNGKENYELKEGNKVLLKTTNKNQVVNRIANLYIKANKLASKNRR